MKIFIYFIITIALYSSTLYASSDVAHVHEVEEVSKEEILISAKRKIKMLIEESEIDTSWIDATVVKSKRTKSKYTNEWVVVFTNSKVKDKTKHILYIYVNIYGFVLGANHTGR